MNRRTSITLITRALLVSIVVLFVAGNGKSYAQEADIKAAIDAYHAAIGTLNVSKIEPLWAHDNYVMAIQPGSKSIAVGWDAVKKGWDQSLGPLSELKVTQMEGPHIHVNGDVAWSTGIAEAIGKSKTGVAINAPTFETDVFEKRGGAWLLVSHTALRVPK